MRMIAIRFEGFKTFRLRVRAQRLRRNRTQRGNVENARLHATLPCLDISINRFKASTSKILPTGIETVTEVEFMVSGIP